MLMLKDLVRSKAGRDSDPQHVRTSLQSLPPIPSAMQTASPPTGTRIEDLKSQKPSLRFKRTGYNSRKTNALEAKKTIHPSGTPTFASTTTASSDGTGQLSRSDTSNTSVSQSSLVAQTPTSNPSTSQSTPSRPLDDGATSGHLQTPPVQKAAVSESLAPILEVLSTVTPNELSKSPDEGSHTAPTGIENTYATVSPELKEILIEKFPSPLRISADCFIAMHLEMKLELASEFEKIMKPRLRAFLQHLRLEDPRISLDCAMAGRTSAVNTFKPTILFICFNERQKKAIENGIASKRNLISSAFVCRVVVQELRLISSFTSIPSEPGSLSGQIVEANMHPHSITLCGVRARLMGQEDLISQPLCTIGGLILVGGALYALTTAHSFMDNFSRTTALGASEFAEVLNFVPLGNLHSYKFTGTPYPNHDGNDSELTTPSETPEESSWEGQDWALIRVQPRSFMRNIAVDPDQHQPVPVEGHLRSDQLSQGNVWVLSGMSGVIHGFLNATEGSVMIGPSVFSVRTIMLDRELADGNSGSWVVRDGKVCGYVFCRVVGRPLAYMLPIGPVLEDIRLAFKYSNATSVEVPSDTKIQELYRDTTSRKMGLAQPPATILSEAFVFSEDPGELSDKRNRPVLGRIPEELSRFGKGKEVAASPPVEMDSGPFSKNPGRFASDSMSETSGIRGAFGSAFDTLIGSTDSSDAEDKDDNLYVQTLLPAFKYDQEDLLHHLKTYAFRDAGRVLLESLADQNGRLMDPVLFRDSPDSERWHNSSYSVFDVGQDGAAVSRSKAVKPGTTRIDSAIWQATQDLNMDASRTSERLAVGRISIIREPSPIVFGALHMIYNKDFDMDELFQYLLATDGAYSTSAHMQRAFNADPRQRRSFFFSFQYLTIVAEEVDPMPWQMSHENPASQARRVIGLGRLSRCSSIVALSLSGNPVRKVKNLSLKAQGQYGFVHDPWAAWQVLNIECYPDFKHSMHSHDSTKHYVNGPEAFMFTLLDEFKDAKKRYEALYSAISKFTIPSVDFIFNPDLRDMLLFDDEDLTFSRRYFWAYQTLGIISSDIKALIDAYEDSFTDDVWDGRHKTIWPMIDKKASRSVHWRKRMNSLKKDFEKEIKSLEQLLDEYDDRRKEIMTLRDQLHAATSVLQGRKMVEQSSIIILQAHNIKLLALATILFLPLIFVACLFGMTNMPADQGFRKFVIVIVSVCVPFYLLIGTLNGNQWWWRAVLYRIASSVGSRTARMEADLVAKRSPSPSNIRMTSGIERPTSSTERPSAERDHTTSPFQRAATMDDKGNRRRIAKVLLSIGDRLGNLSSNQFDASVFKHGKALDFPEIPGEEYRNANLSRTRALYNQSRAAEGIVTPGDLASSTKAARMFDDSEFKHGKALDFPEIPGEEYRNTDLSRIRARYNQSRSADGTNTSLDVSQQGNKNTLKEIPPVSDTGVQIVVSPDSGWWDTFAGRDGKQKSREAEMMV